MSQFLFGIFGRIISGILVIYLVHLIDKFGQKNNRHSDQ